MRHFRAAIDGEETPGESTLPAPSLFTTTMYAHLSGSGTMIRLCRLGILPFFIPSQALDCVSYQWLRLPDRKSVVSGTSVSVSVDLGVRGIIKKKKEQQK